METKYTIRDFPVIKSNIKLNHLGIRNRCITRRMVQAIAAGLNKIYDEQGDDAASIDIEMLNRASGVRPETLRGNCKNPTGARMICEGVFIKDIQDVILYTNGHWKMKRNTLSSDANLTVFLDDLAKLCYDPVSKEIVKLLTRGVNPDVWYMALEPAYESLLPGRELFSEETKQRHNHKLAALMAADFAAWVRTGIDLQHEEQFKQGIKDDISYINYAIQNKLKQLL